MNTIITTVHTNLTSALESHTEITGENFYECFENQRVYATEEETYFVNKNNGSIYYTVVDDKGLTLFHKLSIHNMLSNGGFNKVILGDAGDSQVFISVAPKNWANTAPNRKVMVEECLMVTSLDRV